MLTLLTFYYSLFPASLRLPYYGGMTSSDDLMAMISARFDDTNARIDTLQKSLDGLESKEHAASEIQYLTYRITAMETNLNKLKSTLWRTVCTVSSVVAFIVTVAVSLIVAFA